MYDARLRKRRLTDDLGHNENLQYQSQRSSTGDLADQNSYQNGTRRTSKQFVNIPPASCWILHPEVPYCATTFWLFKFWFVGQTNVLKSQEFFVYTNRRLLMLSRGDRSRETIEGARSMWRLLNIAWFVHNRHASWTLRHQQLFFVL